MRGAAGVPVVEAEDAIASSCGERLAKGRRPADPLGSEARDQQDGLVCRIAETVPHQVDAVGQPRPQRAPDRIGEVSLAELGAASVRDMKVEAPVAGLIDIVERRPVTANAPNAGVSLQLFLKGGRLAVSIVPIQAKPDGDDAQGKPF